jgi:putative hydrolase of the HAD superfamily
MSQTRSIIKAVLFDIDGVLIPEDENFFHGRLARDYNVPLEHIIPFFLTEFPDCLKGKKEIHKALEDYLPMWSWTGTVDDLLEYWFGKEARVDDRMTSIIDELKKNGFEVYIASNQEKQRAMYLMETVGFKDIFSRHFFSCDLGHLKSEGDYFENMLRHVPFAPNELQFWDNTKHNIDVASSFGIDARHFTTYDNFESSIRKLINAKTKEKIEIENNEEEAVREIAKKILGHEQFLINRHRGGSANIVFEAVSDNEKIIIQLNRDIRRFFLYKWSASAMNKARKAGVPVSETLDIGVHGEFSYMVYKKIQGTVASDYSGDKSEIWFQMGEYARRINTIKAPGYGTIRYSERKVGYRREWRTYIGEEIDRVINATLQYFDDSLPKIIQRELLNMKGWKFEPKLIHGNLDLKNIIVDDEGKIRGIIDWDEAIYAKSPEFELVTTLAWIQAESEEKYNSYRREFLRGYGINGDELLLMKEKIRSVQFLKYLEYLDWYTVLDKDSASVKEIKWRIERLAENQGLLFPYDIDQ